MGAIAVKRLYITLAVVAFCSLSRGQITPKYEKNVFTTNLFYAPVLAGSIPYYDFANGKFVGTPLAYTNGFVYEPTLGFLSIFRTNTTGDLLMNLQEGGVAGPSIQGYANRFVVANTNLSLEAVGPFSVDMRVDGSNKVQAVQGGMSLVGKTNIISDDGTDLTYNGERIGRATLQALYYGGHYGFGSSSVTPTNIFVSNLPAGITDLYTVPTGRKFVVGYIGGGSTNATSMTACLFLKTNGVYYRWTTTQTYTTNVSSPFQQGNLIFEAGESVATSNTLAGLNMFVTGTLLGTNINLYSPKSLSLASGNNTIYTCPAGKCAVNMLWKNTITGNPGLAGLVINMSGATRVMSFYVVPSGGAADSSTIRWHASLSNITTSGLDAPLLFPGDSVVINTDASTAIQWAYLTVAEIPFP